MGETQTNQTVYQATYDLLRRLGLTTIFGNPGSTEQPFLKNFPSDFEYVLALQEASAVAMADGFAQATHRPALLNLYTSAGMGNGMGNIMTAYLNKTPLIITAGQQTREMILCDPLLTNRDETMLPRPWVKWAYQPVRAQDVPGAIMRAYAIALQPPSGPVFVSIPLDDWDQPALGDAVVRSVSSRFSPDPERVALFAKRIQKAKNPVLVYGQEIEHAGGWKAGIKFAERMRTPVYLAPMAERASFPQNHSQFRGGLPIAIGPLSKRLLGHDLIIVIGAPILRYYPYVAETICPTGPNYSSSQMIPVMQRPRSWGIVYPPTLGWHWKHLSTRFLKQLRAQHQLLRISRVNCPDPPNSPLTAIEVFAALSELRPEGAILVQERPSNGGDLLQCWPTLEPDSYYTFASGGLGWNAPAAVGIAIAQKKAGSGRPVIAVIGDGSLQYSVQSLYTAAQHKLKLIYIVPCNDEYAILKEFAVLEKTPNVPALDLPGLDIATTAKAFGCIGVDASTIEEIKKAFKAALQVDGPTLIAIPIARQLRPLVPDVV